MEHLLSKRNKAENENIYYNVDKIHIAINRNNSIKFQYFDLDVNKRRQIRRNGEFYTVSPWALSWDDEKYYLVAFDATEDCIKHFRVDKMLNIELTGSRRKGSRRFREFDMGAYAKKMFGMFNGMEETVKIECRNEMAHVIIDRFGKDIVIVKQDNGCFHVNVKVAVSTQFLSWVFALGDGVKIISPPDVVDMLQQEIKRLSYQYNLN